MQTFKQYLNEAKIDYDLATRGVRLPDGFSLDSEEWKEGRTKKGRDFKSYHRTYSFMGNDNVHRKFTMGVQNTGNFFFRSNVTGAGTDSTHGKASEVLAAFTDTAKHYFAKGGTEIRYHGEPVRMRICRRIFKQAFPEDQYEHVEGHNKEFDQQEITIKKKQ